MQKSIQLLLAFLCLTITTQAQNYKDTLDQKIGKKIEASRIKGVGVAIFTKEGIAYENGFGYADEANKKPYTMHTTQNIGSISKTFIGVALAKAVEDGHLTWDTPINDILPFKINNPRHPNVPITVGQLASHTSSIRDSKYYDEKCYYYTTDRRLAKEVLPKGYRKQFEAMKGNKAITMAKLLKEYLVEDGEMYLKKNFYNYAPGKYYNYSNVGSAVAAYVLEVATGVSFKEYTERYIFAPIGMDNSGWAMEDIDAAKHSKLYFDNGIEIPSYALLTYPDGGCLTSVHQLALYFSELAKGREGKSNIMEQESFQMLMTPHVSDAQIKKKKERKDEDRYGYFMEINGPERIGHNGGDPGVVTFAYFNPVTEVGLIMFYNSDMLSKKAPIEDLLYVWGTLSKYSKPLVKS